MRVWADRRIEARAIDVYVEVAPHTALVLDPVTFTTTRPARGGSSRVVDVGQAEPWPVFVRLEDELAGLILRALDEVEVVIPEPATRAHLRDAMAQRDRLMALVENVMARDWPAPNG